MGYQGKPGTPGIQKTPAPKKQQQGSTSMDMWSMIPEVPALNPYEGYSNQYGVSVGLTPGEKAAETLATNLITGKEGSFKQSLSGEPNYAQVNRLIGIQQRDMQEQVLPSIAKSAAAGPYKNTGLAKRMEADAQLSQSDQEANLRFQAYQQAKQEALAAAQLLPSLTGVTGITRNNEINNILRDMEVHYKNQGLTAQQYAMDAQRFSNSMALAQFEYQQWIDMENLRMQKEAAAAASRSSGLGMLGGLAGAALGTLVPGVGNAVGAAIGYQLGSGVGYAAGGDRVSGQTQLGSALGTAANYSLYQQQLENMNRNLYYQQGNYGPYSLKTP